MTKRNGRSATLRWSFGASTGFEASNIGRSHLSLCALWLLSSRPIGHAGDMAARPTEIGNETTFDRIAAADEHDRYGRGGSAGGTHDDIWADDHSHLPLRQIRRECRQPIELVLRPAKFDRDVVAVDEPGFLQTVAEGRYPVNGIGSRGGIKETDHRY